MSSSNFLNFSEALYALRWGDKIARRSWGFDGQYLSLDYDAETIRWHMGSLYHCWTATPDQILAEDWYVVSDV